MIQNEFSIAMAKKTIIKNKKRNVKFMSGIYTLYFIHCHSM